jgi:hypothetical protein
MAWRVAYIIVDGQLKHTCAQDRDFVEDGDDSVTCGVVHRSDRAARWHTARLNTGEFKSALKERDERYKSLPAVGEWTRSAWKRLLLASGPMWAPIPDFVALRRDKSKKPRGGPQKMLSMMERYGLIELAGDEFRVYRLTDYGVWCRDRWICIDFSRRDDGGS